MRVATLSTRDLRNLEDGEVALGPGTTVLVGPNGAGKTNLLEGLYFALTGRSCRTRRERELIRFGRPWARAEARLEPGEVGATEAMTMGATVSRSDGRTRRVDGRPAEAADDRRRPAVSVFMPDRLALVKGPPAPRRAHLDRLAAALRPGRDELRSAYARALAQRNAMLSRVRRGSDPAGLDAWDAELAARAEPLVESRAEAARELEEPFRVAAERLGLEGDVGITYRPATGEASSVEIAAELRTRRDADLDRGHTIWGPHRDELDLTRDGRQLRRYGSQGQQRLGLLSLLFAEREVLRGARLTLPLMLLDDVMSELDPERRRRLVDLLAGGGQALITATERDHVPSGIEALVLPVEGGAVGAPGPEPEGAG